jgi:hypothetical protein
MRVAGGAPESQSWVYRGYSLCWRWVQRWCVGVWVGSVGGWVSGEMGSRDGDGGELLPHTSDLGVLLKNPQV